MEKLKTQEDAVEASLDADKKAVKAAMERMRVARSKLKRLRKQKRLLKRREKEIFELGQEDAEELERLEEQEFFY
jgi:hypothetical protein